MESSALLGEALECFASAYTCHACTVSTCFNTISDASTLSVAFPCGHSICSTCLGKVASPLVSSIPFSCPVSVCGASVESMMNNTFNANHLVQLLTKYSTLSQMPQMPTTFSNRKKHNSPDLKKTVVREPEIYPRNQTGGRMSGVAIHNRHRRKRCSLFAESENLQGQSQTFPKKRLKKCSPGVFDFHSQSSQPVSNGVLLNIQGTHLEKTRQGSYSHPMVLDIGDNTMNVIGASFVQNDPDHHVSTADDEQFYDTNQFDVSCDVQMDDTTGNVLQVDEPVDSSMEIHSREVNTMTTAPLVLEPFDNPQCDSSTHSSITSSNVVNLPKSLDNVESKSINPTVMGNQTDEVDHVLSLSDSIDAVPETFVDASDPPLMVRDRDAFHYSLSASSIDNESPTQNKTDDCNNLSVQRNRRKNVKDWKPNFVTPSSALQSSIRKLPIQVDLLDSRECAALEELVNGKVISQPCDDTPVHIFVTHTHSIYLSKDQRFANLCLNTLEYNHARKMGMEIVSGQWLIESAQCMKLLPMCTYHVHGDFSFDSASSCYSIHLIDKNAHDYSFNAGGGIIRL